LVLPPEGMRTVLVQMPEAVRSASVAEVNHILVATLPGMRDEVPEIVCALQTSARVFLTGVGQVHKFDWIAYPEDRRRVTHEVPVALLSIEF
jgi:hypothetical protein